MAEIAGSSPASSIVLLEIGATSVFLPLLPRQESATVIIEWNVLDAVIVVHCIHTDMNVPGGVGILANHNDPDYGKLVQMAPRVCTLLKRAVAEYDRLLAAFDEARIWPTRQIRHNFVVMNSGRLAEALMNKVQWQIYVPFGPNWMRFVIRERTKTKHPRPIIRERSSLPSRIVWSAANSFEVAAARTRFESLVAEGRTAYRIKGNKWIPIEEFDGRNEEIVLAFRKHTEPQVFEDRPEVRPLPEIYRQIKPLIAKHKKIIEFTPS